MRQIFYFSLILICGILLFGCIANIEENGGDNYTNYTGNDNNTVISDFEFSVPSELPIAYVGTPYFYSFCNPEPAGELSSFFGYACGENGTSINPSGGNPPYYIETRNITGGYNRYKVYPKGGVFLNFTPKIGDEGEYTIEICASDSEYDENQHEICKNTTLYIMSDTVTVKGKGELNYSLMLKLNSRVEAMDYRGTEVTKNATTGYVPTTSFLFNKITAEIQPAPSSCTAFCGGGSYASLDITTSYNSVQIMADGNAACGDPLGDNFPGEYNVDYYMVGFVGYANNAYIALAVTNTGTEEKYVDIHLETSSELGMESKNYYDATANAELCIDEECIESPTGSKGNEIDNSTVIRAGIRPGSHWIAIGSMNNNFANTGGVRCPSVVKSASRISVVLNEADIYEENKKVDALYSYETSSGTMESIWRTE